MICVVILQNVLDVVESPTGSYIGTCVTCDDDDGTEEVCMKVEQAIDIMDEIPEAITFPLIKTEQEVRLWGVCDVSANASMSFVAPKRNCKIVLNYLLLCVLLSVPFTCQNLDCKPEEKVHCRNFSY